jgi:hypothetical protein
MAGLLLLEIVIWFALVLSVLLTVLALVAATRKATRPEPGLDDKVAARIMHHHLNERTILRWSRIVKLSNTAFWAHVSTKTDSKQPVKPGQASFSNHETHL